jgi:hypothetical protein
MAGVATSLTSHYHLDMWTKLAKIFTWVGVVIVAAGFMIVWFNPVVGGGVIILGLIFAARASTLVDHWNPPRWK